jgi:hypothetical protein
VILLICASLVARITGVSHWPLAIHGFLDAAGNDLTVLLGRPVLVNLPLHWILLSRPGGHLRDSDCLYYF